MEDYIIQINSWRLLCTSYRYFFSSNKQKKIHEILKKENKYLYENS